MKTAKLNSVRDTMKAVTKKFHGSTFLLRLLKNKLLTAEDFNKDTVHLPPSPCNTVALLPQHHPKAPLPTTDAPRLIPFLSPNQVGCLQQTTQHPTPTPSSRRRNLERRTGPPRAHAHLVSKGSDGHRVVLAYRRLVQCSGDVPNRSHTHKVPNQVSPPPPSPTPRLLPCFCLCPHTPSSYVLPQSVSMLLR